MTKRVVDDDPLDREIDFSNVHPNPYAKYYGRNRNLRVLAPDLLTIFPDSESVNEALRTLVCIAAASAVPVKRNASTATAPKPKKKARA